MHTARIPPVDAAPATITAVLAMHAGHICPSSELLHSSAVLLRTEISRFRTQLGLNSKKTKQSLCRLAFGHCFSCVFCQVHVSSHVPAVASRPTAHTSERNSVGNLPKFGSRVFLALGTVPPCQCLRGIRNQAHLCAWALLAGISLFACDSCQADSAVWACHAAFTRVGSDFLSQVFLLRQLHGQCRQPSGGSRARDDQP